MFLKQVEGAAPVKMPINLKRVEEGVPSSWDLSAHRISGKWGVERQEGGSFEAPTHIFFPRARNFKLVFVFFLN